MQPEANAQAYDQRREEAAMQGPAMREALFTLAANFDEIAVPKRGRYVDTPARADEHGVTYVPPKP